MSRNNTGNPIGSKAFPDFEDNVPNLDVAVNSDQDTWRDRLGKSRLTWAGIERSGAGDTSIAVDAAARAVAAAEQVEQDAEQIAQDAAQQAVDNVVIAVDGAVERAEGAADRSEAAAAASFAAGNLFDTTAQGLTATIDGQYFLLRTADPQVFDVYLNDGGVAVLQPDQFTVASWEDINDIKVTSSALYDQPNLFSVEQQEFSDLSIWNGNGVVSVGMANGRRCLKVLPGFIFGVKSRESFSETGLVSASLVVERLIGAVGSSRLRVTQKDSAGANLVVSDSLFGVSDISTATEFAVSGIPLHPNTATVEYYIMPGVTGSEVWVRSLLWAEGGISGWRPAPPQTSIPEWQRLPNRVSDPGFSLGVMPDITVGQPVMEPITSPALVAMGAVNGFKMSGSASAQVLMLEPVPEGSAGKYVLMAAYAYSPNGAWSPSASNSVYLNASDVVVTAGLKHEYVDINTNVRLYLSYGVIPITAAKFAIGKFDLQASGVTNRLLTGIGYWIADAPLTKGDVLHDVFYPAGRLELYPDEEVNRVRAQGLSYEQPNLFTRDQLTFDDLTGWQVTGMGGFEVEVVNGRRTLKMTNGTLFREYDRWRFEESGQISASLWVEKLENASRTYANFIIDQYDSGGALIGSGAGIRGIANMGTGSYSEPRQLKIAGLPLHADCETVRFSIIPGTHPGAEVNVRDLLIAQGDNPEFRLPAVASGGGGGSGGLSGTITIANADKICQLGDSYTESVYVLKDKNTGARVGELSDWRVQSWGVSGYDNGELVNALLTGMERYGTSYAEINPSHTLIVSRANDNFAASLSWDYWRSEATRLIQTVQAFGSKPILAGEHPKTLASSNWAQVRSLADSFGLPFIDVASDAQKFEYSTSQYLWEGTHPGTRANSVLWKPILDYVQSMPRPRTGLKVFRPRLTHVAGPRAGLLYDNILERAEIWKELTTGHRGLMLSESSKYDAVAAGPDRQTVADQELYHDEYQILHRGGSVAFNRYVLIEAILPSMGRDLDFVKLNTSGSAALNVYAINRRSPLPFSLARMRGFVNASEPGVVGDVYSVPESGIFYVAGNHDGMVILEMGEGHRTPNAPGTLTRTSGTGPETITYTGTSNAFDPAYYGRFNDPIGEWEQVPGGELSGTLIARYMQEDKIAFLVEAAGEFTLSDISVEYQGRQEKPALRPATPLPARGPELLPQTLVGEIGELADWTITGSVVGTDTAINSGSPPVGTTKVVRIDDENYISQEFFLPTDRQQSGEMEVTVWCRRWEPLFDPTADIATSPITSDTFDFAKLEIYYGLPVDDLEHSALSIHPVPLGWVEIKHRVQMPSQYVGASEGNARRLTIKGGDNRMIEVGRVSVRGTT